MKNQSDPETLSLEDAKNILFLTCDEDPEIAEYARQILRMNNQKSQNHEKADSL